MNKKLLILIGMIVIVIDQASKFLFSYLIKAGSSITIIKKVFYLSYVKNYGVAFNMLNNKRFIIILFSIILLSLIYNYMKSFKNNKRNLLAFGLLYGGIIGNLIDRAFFGYVRDFIDIYIINYNYPVFNIADSAIVIGIILLIIAIFKKEDLSDGVQSSSK